MLATMKPSWSLKEKDPNILDELEVRVIEYKVDGHPPIRIATSLLDYKKFPGRDLAILLMSAGK